MPAITPSSVDRVSARTRSTVTAAATATDRPANRFMRKAGSPNGLSSTFATHPRTTYVGKPVGWATPISGATAWSSAVSQNPSPGIIARRAATNATSPTRIGGSHVTMRPGHHPRMRPHITPHALTAMETTTSPITRGIAQTRRRARSTSHEDPIAMRTSANGTTSLLNR